MTETPAATTDLLEAQLAAAENLIETLHESLADASRMLARDEAGWAPLGSADENLTGFTHEFRRKVAALSLVATAANPLIKRGVNLRAAYVWGDGVEISVRDSPDQGQDVNAVVQAFLDDPSNTATFTDTDAKIEFERTLARCGEVFLALPTDPITGRVRVRTVPFSQITQIVSDPEDEATPWLYLREWTKAGATSPSRLFFPALGFRPAVRAKQWKADGIEGLVDIAWDRPMRHVAVNRVGLRGLGDTFAAVPWADAYKGFLEDWAKLTKSLARFAWQVKTRGDKAAVAAARMQRTADEAGQGVAMDPNSYLEAVGKSGATIDSDSGRPLAAMVAAALDLPVTTLLGDPGITGARAVASDITESSWEAFNIRRDLWRSVIRDVIGYVIDSAVIAPAGPLHGEVRRDSDRVIVDLGEDDGRTVEVIFPARNSESMLDRVKSIAAVDQAEKIPPLVLAKLYLEALGVRDVDDVLNQITDDEGNYVPLDVIDERVRARLRAQGEAA